MDGHRHHHGNEEDDDDDDDDEDDEGDGRDKKKNSIVHQHQQIVDKQSRFSLSIFIDILKFDYKFCRPLQVQERGESTFILNIYS